MIKNTDNRYYDIMNYRMFDYSRSELAEAFDSISVRS